MPHPPQAQARPMPNAEAAEFDWYVGIDCGGAAHHVCVLDAPGHRVGERAVAHSGQELAAFVAWLHELAGPSLARVAVALETPHGRPAHGQLAEHSAQILERRLRRAAEAGCAGARSSARRGR